MLIKRKLPDVAVLKIRGFKSKLPEDFVQLINVETKPMAKTFLRIHNNTVTGKVIRQTHDTFMHMPSEADFIYKTMGGVLNKNVFYIRENEILFMGNYSKNTFIRWIQLLIERIAPQEVILKYIGINNDKLYGNTT